MKCHTCKSKRLPKMKLYTFEELQTFYQNRDKYHYTQEEIAEIYNLYNRVFNDNKSPGCGKCFVNVRKKLTMQFEVENQNQ